MSVFSVQMFCVKWTNDGRFSSKLAAPDVCFNAPFVQLCVKENYLIHHKCKYFHIECKRQRKKDKTYNFVSTAAFRFVFFVDCALLLHEQMRKRFMCANSVYVIGRAMQHENRLIFVYLSNDNNQTNVKIYDNVSVNNSICVSTPLENKHQLVDVARTRTHTTTLQYCS